MQTPECKVCDDTGLVDVDTLDDKQPCLWCDIGKAVWWSQVVIVTHIYSSLVERTKE